MRRLEVKRRRGEGIKVSCNEGKKVIKALGSSKQKEKAK
jgi:hypothetical protein